MTNYELLVRLEKLEKELAENKVLIDHLAHEVQRSQMLSDYICAFMPQLSEAAKHMTFEQYEAQAERVRRHFREMEEELIASARSETSEGQHDER